MPSSTSVVAITAPVTSCIAWMAASFGLRPSCMSVWTRSTTTIASSTTVPIARTSPNSVRMLME